MTEVKDIPVLIGMQTVIHDGSRQETTNVQAKGTLTSKGNATYIRYEEEMAEAGSVRNVVKIGQNDVTIVRNGAVSMRQRFQEGVTTEGRYKSPVGTMKMETETKRVTYDWDGENGCGRFCLDYDLTLQDRGVGRFELTMKLKEALQT